MKHFYTSVGWDGEKYTYTCSCGHTVVTSDGMLPIELVVDNAHKKVLNKDEVVYNQNMKVPKTKRKQ